MWSIFENDTANAVARGAGLGGALGASIGSLYGTYDAYAAKIPGLYKLRHIGTHTLTTSAAFAVLVGCGALLRR
eukprot:jgi/Ulvmu1/1491/UM011_0221.1